MGREHQSVSPTAGSALIAGSISSALAMHAHERIVHFFMFLFALDACCRRAKATGAADVNAWSAVSPKATHQVDTGFRKTDPAYYDFDETDPKVVDRSAASCRNTDAAHFCNLGLVAGPWQQLAATATGDKLTFYLLEMAKRLAGNTRHLPQRINIGPDRVIDVAHGDLAVMFLKTGKPVVSRANIGDYLARSASDMTDYRAGASKAGLHGLAACCDAYLAVYANGVEPPYFTLSGYVWAECAARAGALDRTLYLD